MFNNLNIVEINVYKNIEQIPSIRFKDIERK